MRKSRKRSKRRGRRKRRPRAHKVLEHTYPELSVARATLVKLSFYLQLGMISSRVFE